jgi:hypothetical protein
MELRAFCILGKHCTTELYSPSSGEFSIHPTVCYWVKLLGQGYKISLGAKRVRVRQWSVVGIDEMRGKMSHLQASSFREGNPWKDHPKSEMKNGTGRGDTHQ